MDDPFFWSPDDPPIPQIGEASVGVVSTTRRGGLSPAPYDSLNLGRHVGDDPDCVAKNRQRLSDAMAEKLRFAWLSQVHKTRVVNADQVAGTAVEADASITRTPGVACVIMSADCLPVLLFDKAGTVVGAAHAGWRGLVAGIVEATIDAMATDPAQLVALLGPAIGPDAFEIGDEVRQAFLDADPQAGHCFSASPFNPTTRWVADLYDLCRRRLRAQGVATIHGGQQCTYSDEARFFSYRRDGKTGRMATAIWLRRNVPFHPTR